MSEFGKAKEQFETLTEIVWNLLCDEEIVDDMGPLHIAAVLSNVIGRVIAVGVQQGLITEANAVKSIKSISGPMLTSFRFEMQEADNDGVTH